jgi:hypothetical protein
VKFRLSNPSCAVVVWKIAKLNGGSPASDRRLPGDVVAFHFRTLHDAPGNSSTARRRAVSLRWLGDDAVFALRPWLHSPPFEQRGLVEGGPLDDERFPLVAT